MDSGNDSKIKATTKEQDVKHVYARPAKGGEAQVSHKQRNENLPSQHEEETPLSEADDLEELLNDKLVNAEKEREDMEHKKAEKKRNNDVDDEPTEVGTPDTEESVQNYSKSVGAGKKLKVRFDIDMSARDIPRKKYVLKNVKGKKSKVKDRTKAIETEGETEHHDQQPDAQSEKDTKATGKRKSGRAVKTPDRYDPSRGVGSKGEGVPPKESRKTAYIPGSSPLIVKQGCIRYEDAETKPKNKKGTTSTKEAEFEVEARGNDEKDDKLLESEGGLAPEIIGLFTGTIIDLLHENRDEIVNCVKKRMYGGEEGSSKKTKKYRRWV